MVGSNVYSVAEDTQVAYITTQQNRVAVVNFCSIFGDGTVFRCCFSLRSATVLATQGRPLSDFRVNQPQKNTLAEHRRVVAAMRDLGLDRFMQQARYRRY